MLELFKADPQIILGFSLVLCRVTAFFFASALFSLTNLSMSLRVLLSLLMTMIIFPIVMSEFQSKSGGFVTWTDFEYIFAMVAEVMKGLVLGFITRLFFFVCASFGEFLSLSMGLNSSQLFNPAMGSQGSSMEQFVGILGTMFFLALNGHHYLVNYLVESFSTWNVQSGFSGLGNLGNVVTSAGELIWLAVKLCSPVMIALLLVQLSMGVLGRAVPQLNVLVASFPVTIMLGFMMLILVFPMVVGEWHNVLDWSMREAYSVLRAHK